MALPPSISVNGPEGQETMIFSEATPEQLLPCYKLGAVNFAPQLPEKDFIECCEYIGQLPLAQGKGSRFWCLARESNPGHVVAMCKTLHRDLLTRDAAGTREGQGYCIGMVATDARYRRLGLAAFLMNKVAEWMDGPGEGIASMLYSSVGEFYVDKGWKILPASQSTLSVGPGTIINRLDLPRTRSLTAEDIPQLCARDIGEMKADFVRHKLAADEVLMAVVPTPKIVTWLHDWMGFFNMKVTGKVQPSKGAICEDAGVWVYWDHRMIRQELAIQRVRIVANARGSSTLKIEEALAGLLLDALAEAQEWKLPKVVVWNPIPELQRAIHLLKDRFGVEVLDEERTSSNIPSVRWRGGNKEKTARVQVYANEYYAWS
ncbi:hypothetical protein AJ79_08467 [Helicocarpus griseus UAMH5409]|uniref:N-acetyltransferase domain-containing protein n=1 Tax=Helicocarpus griseus UAMH5409 TaxID=1447875 RepID=A0A2B7WT15_9EURO|nr:hypothetical protein AJ79_08467 [Helicocarpus griseus UAMH5409]